MQWNKHYEVEEGSHAILSPSNYHWTNYDDEKLITSIRNSQAKERGTKLHALAAELISLGINVEKSDKTFNKYVNDAIGFGLDPEVLLKYSDNSYGTADSIMFMNHPDKKSPFKYFLRIHDLKTGATPACMRQLELYAALFFLEYKIKPEETEIELRIYQNDEIIFGNPTAKEIKVLMKRYIHCDKIVEKIKLEG